MKIAIVGGGICGLYLAWKLAERDEEVAVFERKKEIGENVVCSGHFSERIFNFIPQAKNLIEKEIKNCFLHFPKKTIKLSFSERFFLINHSQLDKLTFSLAKNAGAEIKLNSEIKSLLQDYDRTIGCDGALSSVRRELGLNNPKFLLGIQGFSNERVTEDIPLEATEECPPDFTEVWPLPKNGFIWKIPKTEETEYGIMGDIKSAKKDFDKFLADRNLNIEKFNSKIIPQGLIISDNFKVTLCGDAAGLTKPWSGGGVIWGLKAADILLETFPDFVEYKKRAEKYFKPKIFISKNLSKLAYFMGFNFPFLLPSKFKMQSDSLLLTKFK